MKIIASYNKKWLIYILTFFLFFTAVLLVSEYFHEKRIRINALNKELDNYTGMINQWVSKYRMNETHDFSGLDTLINLISNKALRITLIDLNGEVKFDSEVKNAAEMENHLQRPEIQIAINQGHGTDIRLSGTTNIKYYYYARQFTDNFIRVSVVYDINAKKFIQPDRIFLLLIVLIFLVASFTIVLITDKFGKSISTLRDFTLKALANKSIDDKIVFPENELGLIGQDIIDIYQKLNNAKEELLSEKAKLIRHLNMLDEGIAIYSKDMVVITNNNHFIQLINLISDKRVFSADEFFVINDFSPILSFINKFLKDEKADLTNFQPTYEITLNKNSKYFSIRSTVFQDKSFEVSIHDVTKPAKRKLIKHQLTENIAHELKTPVSSIKGFLETIMNNNPDEVKTKDFIRRAYSQTARLADLINDISLLTKIEEAGNLYEIEKVNINELVTDIVGEIKPKLKENRVNLELSLADNLIINGNPVLLYSVFRNLFDNTISHAGNNITVKLENYLDDSKFYYFSFSDNGIGVPSEDLPRLFERFYRVDKGRDRKKGGTGLGLAIVKNAIQFHKGDISVKNRSDGGLEFLFTLSKEL